MLSFVKNWLGPKANPIGVDFGTDSLKLAQVARQDNEWRLHAAASMDVPSHARHDPAARLTFFTEAVRDLLVQGHFAGRQAVLTMPAAFVFIQHLRLPKMDDDAMKKAIPWEARGKLPIDPTHAMIRHHVAGEVYQDQEARNEIILMAAGRDLVTQYLAAAAKAKLDIIGMNVEPKAIVDCFGHIYRRKTDTDMTNCFVDIGNAGTRAVIARGSHMLFARNISIGGEHLTRAIAAAASISEPDARLLRQQLSTIQPPTSEPQPKPQAQPEQPPAEGFAMLDAALAAAGEANPPAPERRKGPSTAEAGLAVPQQPARSAVPADLAQKLQQVEEACREPLARLVEELNMCRRYYEATFPNKPVDRLVFVGGEARHRWLCQFVAREMGLAAQVGDPLIRMGRVSNVGIESGIDCRLPQPNWAVAIGLSLGPVMDEANVIAA